MVKQTSNSTIYEKLVLELRRGVLVLATLSQLGDPKYGYALQQQLSSKGLEIEQGTLYPLLRRLEEQGLLLSQWNVEGSRPRRYYELSPDGEDLLRNLSVEWHELVEVIDGLLSSIIKEGNDESN